MLRRWFHRFWMNNKDKIIALGKGAFLLSLISFFAVSIFSLTSQYKDDRYYNDENNIYKPTSTVIKGDKITKEVYDNNSQTIENFIEYCNLGDAKSAYNMLSDDCKNNVFPTLEAFTKDYLKEIFSESRIYNLQSWIVNNNSVTYRIRILDDLLSTGSYTESVKYQDYITIDNSSENSKISVKGFIESDELNLNSQTDEFYAEVIKKKTYIDYEEYIITVKNLTKKDVILDPIESFSDTVLVGENDVKYYVENIKEHNLLQIKLGPNITRKLSLKFKKNYSSSKKSNYIEFKNIIKDVSDYTEKATFKIDL